MRSFQDRCTWVSRMRSVLMDLRHRYHERRFRTFLASERMSDIVAA